jgi:hypothetical protein
MSNTGSLTQAMREYAQAIRGDWSNFDGRSARNVIEGWAAEIDNPTGETLEQWRNRLGICPDGNGHWAGIRWGHCTPEECPTQATYEVSDD